MKRRDVIRGLGAGAAAAAVAACSRDAGPAGSAADTRTFEWRLVTTWPANFPGLGTGAIDFAKRVEACSAGRLKIRIYGDGELVPAFETFDAVSSGTAEMGHGASYYWKGKVPAASFFASIPFGLIAQEMNAWLYNGGGLELWQEAYAPFGLLPVPCGSSGTQMGGWFRKEIRSLADIKGLKMRIPALGGEIIARAGGTPVTMPGSEIFTSLQSGAIDAAEWIGPYNDLAFGLHKAAKYYYYPGWQEPGSALEMIINQAAFEAAARRPARDCPDLCLGDQRPDGGGVHGAQCRGPADARQGPRRPGPALSRTTCCANCSACRRKSSRRPRARTRCSGACSIR